MGREHKEVYITYILFISLACALSIVSCGDDKENNDNESAINSNADAGLFAGNGSVVLDSGLDGSTGTADNRANEVTITPLPDSVVGKECTTDADCGPGRCATEIIVQALFGTERTAPGGYCTGECLQNSDCGAGGICSGAFLGQPGICYAGCADSVECREGYICVTSVILAGTCRPAPETDQLENGVVGQACTSDANCPGGVCLSEDYFSGGYCSGACLEDIDCGAGGVCISTGMSSDAGDCFKSCVVDSDCTRDGYRCRELYEGVSICREAADPLPDNVVGRACSGDTDCGGGEGSCVSELPGSSFFGGSLPAVDGYCSQQCEEDLDCGAGGVCIATLQGAVCFKVCQTDNACRDGYICGGRGGGEQPDPVCTPETPEEESDAGAGDTGARDSGVIESGVIDTGAA